MARIRTIKPEFFTSEDITNLSTLARLLYVALWCEADREGRMVWKPKTFKLRYLPADECNAEALCKELTDAGLVVLYGDGLAYIPSFGDHQHLNPREAQSTLPPPDASRRVRTRAPRDSDRSNLDVHAQVGREGKGRERKGKEGEVTLDAWVASLEGGDAVPPDDPIFGWAGKQGIPAEWLGFAWAAFEDRYLDKPKTYTDWRATFRDHVKRGWLDVWRVDQRTGGFVLTTAGEQYRREVSP